MIGICGLDGWLWWDVMAGDEGVGREMEARWGTELLLMVVVIGE